ncbi:histidine kinase HHK2p [Zymoseptoria tritici IPO323]|uniref:histidine kinase n=1 Tax=Zymoseptoria tritici (strain CBS 115943 / IPO323) TaxID=336722 RepID=F9XDR5_ZYMTI|nr:histidine kinase HHK2p [Zymoseptoria tritici IPO323]EGP86539.1 histidine kinase HHK2p [Zymoseptoria tritici IPO323]
MYAQNRARRSYGAANVRLEGKRVSPISEEDQASVNPSLNTVLERPAENVRTLSTVSTESTGSSKTVKGSMPPTPAGQPLRTPSYPFPYVPGTPRTWSSTFHQPFTTLSPTVSNQPRNESETPRKMSFGVLSGDSTPAGNAMFLPPGGTEFGGLEDPRYPTPNLYDLVLQLNSEPGMEQWWTTVTNILHDHFEADRASLVLPVDPTDIENVPWGQKSTFSMRGAEECAAGRTERTRPNTPGLLQRPEFVIREPSSDAPADVRPQKLHPERLRPRLDQRHSYAGPGREARDIPSRDYEEYEQHPTSPWAQSPAPSPAIQADEETNPFFAQDDHQLEDSFNPAVSPKDYAQFAQVEAIGVDHASTIIHIPLIHPTLSQPMQSLKVAARSKGQPHEMQRSNTVDVERKAPIAILSILTATVPYPHNLTHTLKLLGPHLATSFAIAQQLSANINRTVSIRHRRTKSGHNATSSPMTIEPITSLNELAHADLEDPDSSISEPMTSPSEYSGRSRISPAGSIVGTPGWDPAAHGWTAGRSAAGTPALTGSEMVDNYFDSKKRSGNRSASNASITNTPAKSAKKSSSREGRASGHGVEDDASKTPRTPSQQRPSMRPTMSHMPDMNQAKQHSLLHSYGADFQHSFGPLPATEQLDARKPGAGTHVRKGSYPEDMPPPSERLLRTIIDSVPVQIFTAQPETGSLSWVNSKFLIYRGQEPRQVLQDPWQAIHPDDRNEFLPAWHRSLRTNQQLQQKVRLQRFDGSYRWFYVRAAPLKDKRQKVVHWIGTMMDFHEQQIAEINSARQQETAASEAKYRTLANSSPQIVFAVNRVKGITFCNTQWLHYSGQTEAQALGVGFMDYVHPDDLAKCRLPLFDGDSNTPNNVPTSVPSEPKRTVSMSTTSDDSSETEKGGGSRSDFTSSPVGHMPQRQLSELASVGILKVTRDADGRPSYSTEVRLKSRDNDYRWHLVRVLRAEPTVLPNEEETWYGTCTDINDHKTLERDLKENMDEKSRFLSNMSHEIRTPLNGITGMVNFLIDSSLTAEQMEHVNIIRASTEGLRGLINDILDLSKAEAGMIQLSMDWLYVRALIEEVNDLTSAMAIDKGLELNYVVEEDVPPQIKGDRFRIRQILLNIVGNAIKFTQTGEVFIRCCLQTGTDDLEENEAFINFEIVDTGRGFTDQEAEYLFKRFSQIDGSSTRQHGGTGLGLVISKQLAQLHGGDMSARGVPGKGSTFTIAIKTTLPSKIDAPPPPTPGITRVTSIDASPGAFISSTMPQMTKVPSIPELPIAKQWAKFAPEVTQSPPIYLQSPGKESPSYSREATVRHIDMTLPGNIPHQITARESFEECRAMLGGEDPVIFTHIVVVLQEIDEIIALMNEVFAPKTSSTAIVLITDLAQRRKIMEQAPNYDYEALVANRRLRFIFKPLKPSRFGLIFDPQQEREQSLDRNQDSAQQVAVNQKQVFEELSARLGNQDKRVLLVEDNKVNQMVILKFLAKVSIKADTALDGVQCTDKVFAKPHGTYSIILCDLHMPNKDGYQTCKEIRKWERKNKHPHLPIIALSANVLGDVYQKCVDAGFNSYMTKPVDFKELSQVLMSFMDPKDPSKPHELMRLKREKSTIGAAR